jgi:hypothetical protein
MLLFIVRRKPRSFEHKEARVEEQQQNRYRDQEYPAFFLKYIHLYLPA